MHKGKAKNQSWSDIPFDQLTYRPYQDQDDHLCHGSFDELGLVYTKLLE
jgi:hypothetical protein